MIGVTSPFFAELLHQWPHIIHIDDDQQQQKSKKNMKIFVLLNMIKIIYL